MINPSIEEMERKKKFDEHMHAGVCDKILIFLSFIGSFLTLWVVDMIIVIPKLISRASCLRNTTRYALL